MENDFFLPLPEFNITFIGILRTTTTEETEYEMETGTRYFTFLLNLYYTVATHTYYSYCVAVNSVHFFRLRRQNRSAKITEKTAVILRARVTVQVVYLHVGRTNDIVEKKKKKVENIPSIFFTSRKRNPTLLVRILKNKKKTIFFPSLFFHSKILFTFFFFALLHSSL